MLFFFWSFAKLIKRAFHKMIFNEVQIYNSKTGVVKYFGKF